MGAVRLRKTHSIEGSSIQRPVRVVAREHLDGADENQTNNPGRRKRYH
jgi:hypothetical protein